MKVATIQVPGVPIHQFDISWVDPVSRLYYLAEQDNKGITIVDPRTNTVVSQITGFVGRNTSNRNLGGPAGIVVIPSLSQLWGGDGDSTVKVVDLVAQKVIDTISTGGTARADELAYDDRDGIILIANDADAIPFVTFISTKADSSGHHAVLGKIQYPQATNGLEQPVWDRAMGAFFLNVPSTTANPGGEIDQIDPKAMTVTNIFPLDNCVGAGLALGPGQNLLIGCSTAKTIVLNLRATSQFDVYLEGGGVDEVWYNPGDEKYFGASAGGARVNVIDAITGVWLGTINHGGAGGHSVAVDPITNQVYIPSNANANDPNCLNGCIYVYANPAEQ